MAGQNDSPKETSHDVLEKSDCLLLHQLSDHIAEDSAHRIEPFVGRTNVRQTDVIEEDLLNDEDGNGLAELRSGFHNTKAQRDNLGGQKEVDNIGRVILHQSSYHAEGGEAQVFKRARFRGRVKERVKEQGDVSCAAQRKVSCDIPINIPVIIVSTYRSRRACESHCAMRHTARAPAHCRLDLTLRRSTGKGSIRGRLR